MDEPAQDSSMKKQLISNEFYNNLKLITLIVLPALATLYFAVATIWNLPKTEEIMGTATAVITCLGVILRISSSSYYKSDTQFDGDIHPETNADGIRVYGFSLNVRAEEFENKPVVRFQMKP